MGFEVNFNNKPIIKEAQSLQDGGAGNLGYFEQDEEKKKKDRDKSIFSESHESDIFEKDNATTDKDDDFSISKLIAKIILDIKDWCKKFFQIK